MVDTGKSTRVMVYSSNSWWSCIHHGAVIICCIYLLVRLENVQSRLLAVEGICLVQSGQDKVSNDKNKVSLGFCQ